MKKFIIALAIVFSAMFFMGTTAQAQLAAGFHEGCTLGNSGALFGELVATLECPGTPGMHWVVFNPSQNKELLASALTIQSVGGLARVWVAADAPTVIGFAPGQIQTLFGLFLQDF